MLCSHTPLCPDATAVDHDAAVAVLHDDNLNATQLCNGVIVFSDLGELVPEPDGEHYTERGPVDQPALHRAADEPTLDERIKETELALRTAGAELTLVLLQLKAESELIAARNQELEARVALGKTPRVNITPQGFMYLLVALSLIWMYVEVAISQLHH